MNPYEVLGVSENADEETIKKAYRELVKKYHPDKYVNNPLADLAAEKMKEINKAYDMLTGKGTTQNGSSYGSSQGGQSYNTSGNASFAAIRSLIAQSRITEALNMLNSMPRTAEWYYLSGVIRIRSGMYEQGISFLREAVRLEPNNMEYANALNNVMNRTTTYTTGTGGTTSGCLECCTTLMCLRCCCL